MSRMSLLIKRVALRSHRSQMSLLHRRVALCSPPLSQLYHMAADPKKPGKLTQTLDQLSSHKPGLTLRPPHRDPGKKSDGRTLQHKMRTGPPHLWI